MSGSRRKPGRLGPCVDGYRAWLLELGYAPHTVRNQLKVLRQLGRWMANERIDAQRLDSCAIEAFVEARRVEGHRRVPAARSFVPLLDYMRSEGIVAPERPARPLTPLDELIGDYRQWLIVERALAPLTVLRCQKLARRFLGERTSPGDALGVRGLTGGYVTAFLLRECARLSVGSARVRVGELRSLLRFLHARGLTALALADSVPPVAGWRDAGVPATLARADVERLLQGWDRSSLAGARGFAIVVLLARLGLRSVEVARLSLDDLHWRAGEIVVDGKGRRRDRLPLPSDVGEALVGYLSLCDRTDSRRVFLTLRAPTRPIEPHVVSDIVREACRRAGLQPVGAHRLRHALATELLREAPR